VIGVRVVGSGGGSGESGGSGEGDDYIDTLLELE
jgi:hypothetical protein